MSNMSGQLEGAITETEDLSEIETRLVGLEEGKYDKGKRILELGSLGIQDWPNESVIAAEEMVEKYGMPECQNRTMLIWRNNGPWLHTIVHSTPWRHDWPAPHLDVLEQAIPYDVPLDRYSDLAQFDGAVFAERTRGILAARCHKENMNILALNLAHEIATGKRTWQSARAEYVKTVKRVFADQTPEYTKELKFKVPSASGDPDKAVI